MLWLGLRVILLVARRLVQPQADTTIAMMIDYEDGEGFFTLKLGLPRLETSSLSGRLRHISRTASRIFFAIVISPWRMLF